MKILYVQFRLEQERIMGKIKRGMEENRGARNIGR